MPLLCFLSQCRITPFQQKRASKFCSVHLAVFLIALFKWSSGHLKMFFSLCQNETNQMNTPSEDKNQETLHEQSLVIWRTLCVGNICLMFNKCRRNKRWNEIKRWQYGAESKLKRKLLIHSHANKITHTSPLTDHRAGSVHLNILFIRVQIRPTGKVVCPSTCGVPRLKSTTASFCHRCACWEYSNMALKLPRITWQCKGAEEIWRMWGKNKNSPDVLLCSHNSVCYGLLGRANLSVMRTTKEMWLLSLS